MPSVSTVHQGQKVYGWVCDYEGCDYFFEFSKWKCLSCKRIYCPEHASALLNDNDHSSSDEDDDDDDSKGKNETPCCCYCIKHEPDSREFTERDVMHWALKTLELTMNEVKFRMRNEMQTELDAKREKKKTKKNKKKKKTKDIDKSSPFDVLLQN